MLFFLQQVLAHTNKQNASLTQNLQYKELYLLIITCVCVCAQVPSFLSNSIYKCTEWNTAWRPMCYQVDGKFHKQNI